MLIEELFRKTVDRAGADPEVSTVLWAEVARECSGKGRYYHTLDHLEHMARVLSPYLYVMEDADAVVLAIAYHDIVYKVTRSDNEQRSADLMRARLRPLGVSMERLQRVEEHILATKAHGSTAEPDTAYLCDADLAVLGASPEAYALYASAVRKEYRRYPDLLYRPGRRKVLRHFLGMPVIYRIPAFREQFESAARRNLANELNALGG
jgi:predicted metal-dependent HD superfamily phosphohydrolase